MKVKVLSALSDKTLENKVNRFISNPKVKVMQMQFQASFGGIYVMITYIEQEEKPKVDVFANI